MSSIQKILPAFKSLYSTIMTFLASLRHRFLLVDCEDGTALSMTAGPARALSIGEDKSAELVQGEVSVSDGSLVLGNDIAASDAPSEPFKAASVLPLLERTLLLFEEPDIAPYLCSSFSKAFGDSQLDIVLQDIVSLPTETFTEDISDAPWSPEDSPLPLTPILPPIVELAVDIERKPLAFGLGIDVFNKSPSIEITTCPSFLFESSSEDDFFSTSYLSDDTTLLDTPDIDVSSFELDSAFGKPILSSEDIILCALGVPMQQLPEQTAEAAQIGEP
ncbi:hypothetical protein HGRIS_003391 [Hohenbuehelia grisea]|uniref:Uncharacterized protein n=1 Tax=Hohenbuehelia grisea TaxID=104357 RepID=A0ABR3JG72_9AGAR